MSSTSIDSACRGCGLLCDDLTVNWNGQELFLCEKGCPTARSWFQTGLGTGSENQKEEGTTADKIETVKRWFEEAGSPLLCGLEGLTLQAESALVELAKKERAFLSAGTSPDKIASYQRYGGASCTLGEVQQRADFILLGDVDLFSLWPRFEQRILSPPGRFLSPDEPRSLVFLGDLKQLQDHSCYSEVIDVPPDHLEQAIILLRRFCKGQSEKVSSREENGAEATLSKAVIQQLLRLSEQLLAADYPVLFHSDNPQIKPFLWAKLVSEVNRHARLHSITVSAGRAKGAASETILAMTGFPDHIAFRNNEVIHDADRFQASRLIEKQEVDLVLFAGDTLSPKWLQLFEKIPDSMRLVVIHSGVTAIPQLDIPVIEITTRVPGIHDAGTVLRCDGVPLPLRAVVPSTLQTVSDIINSLLD